MEAQNCLIALLRRLGFAIAWDKVEGPSRNMIFLGIEIDTVSGLFTLPERKLIEFHELVMDILARSRVSLKQLQALAGKLNWASSVVRGGRSYLRRILDVMKPLKSSRHKVKMSSELKDDLVWWRSFLRVFNGKRFLVQDKVTHLVWTDACIKAGGMYYKGDWQYVQWTKDFPQWKMSHINVKETAMIWVAAKRWAPSWQDGNVVIFSDNQVAVRCINKGTSRNPLIMSIIRDLFWLSVVYNVNIECRFLPGKDNCLADAISRLHQRGQLFIMEMCMGRITPLFMLIWPYYFCLHMSYCSFLALIPQILQWLRSARV
jgi:hypothetical protein